VKPKPLSRHRPPAEPSPTERLICELTSALTNADHGSVSTRRSDRLSYAHDASHYLLQPLAVLTPGDVDQVAALLRTASRHNIGVTFRSGGTSLSGQAGGDGLLVDTRRNFRRIEVLDDGERVRVQPGATIGSVNARLAAYGRRLGPDPASESACTIGGVVANNSSGMACGTELNTYRTLDSAVLLLPSGTIIDTAQPDADDRLATLEPQIHAGLRRLRQRVLGNASSVATIRRLFAIKNTMGYAINAFLDFTRPVDILSHLIIGSEGTLAFVAEATFRTVSAHPHAATGLMIFPDLTAATTALPAVSAAHFAAVELLDTASLAVAQTDPQATTTLRGLDVIDHAALLVEHQQPTIGQLEQQIADSRRLFDQLPVTAPVNLSTDRGERAALWHVRKGLYAAVAGARPSGTTALLEDIAVPVEELLPTCTGLTQLFQRHGYGDSVIFGHAKDGNLHFLLNEHFGRSDAIDRYLRFTDDMVDLVLDHGGTLKAEHGTGRIMAPYVPRQYGTELYAVMREIKTLIDPTGTLNPGVLLNDDPTIDLSQLKTNPTVEDEVDRCVECGYCEPVCPSKDLTTTPRRRIVLRREIVRAQQAGDTDLARELERDADYDVVQTCAVDGLCQTACPVLINTGDLVRRLRADDHTRAEQKVWNTAAHHWDGFTRAASAALSIAAAAPGALAATATKTTRTILGTETVPAWSSDLPAGGRRRTPGRTGSTAREVAAVYFPSCLSTIFGPPDGGTVVADAFLALCQRAGVAVRIPDNIASLCCGMPWKSKGLTAGHDTMKKLTVTKLRETSDNGRLPVVVDAASCTQGLKELLEADGIPTVDATVFITDAVLARLPPPARPLESLVLHPTCSSTELGANDALLRIAAAIADEVIVPRSWSCCAFAGDRGLLHPELTASATAAEAAELAPRAATAYASVNRTCEIGMTRATGHTYRHILELLEEVTRSTPAKSEGEA
jgi:D-lactate dehydrogenase